MDKDVLLHRLKHTCERFGRSARWIVFSLNVGIVVGLCGAVFSMGLSFVTIIRGQNPWLLYLLPFGGLAIVALYHLLRDSNDTGTNLVISAIHSGDKLPYQMAPLIFISTLITHLFGGSAGREGAALQLGGSLGNALGHLFHFDDKDKNIMIMCGMSAAFAALFKTPMAAAVFSLEMITVGVMHYSALLPCVISALVADGISGMFGLTAETFVIPVIPAFRIKTAVIVIVLAIISSFLSIGFCVSLHTVEKLYKKYFKNPYLRVFVGGCIIIALTLAVGSQEYNGTGMAIIEKCFEGEVVWEAFLLKLLFTAVTIGAGYKGGEIVPAFCTGAAFGCLFGTLIGFNPELCAAVGMIALFCGVTNCPISSLLIAFEMFGYDAMPYFLLTIAFSYMFSGYFGLYHTQRIVYSKYRTNYINKSTD